MASSPMAPDSPSAVPRPRVRLAAAVRRGSILAAARRAFSDVGDVNGTTMRLVAEQSGVNDGVIYRHFGSKQQLFIEAVVEPLRDAVDSLVAAAETVDKYEPMTRARQVSTMAALYQQLTATLDEMMPLLGLMLFGEPEVARAFYQDCFAVAMDRLSAAWAAVEKRYGHHGASHDLSARAVMGIALVLALERRHGGRVDDERALLLSSEWTVEGFFPPLDPVQFHG